MAESVVSFLLDKLNSSLEEEFKHLSDIRNEIVDVRDELDRMKAFLRDADSMEDEDEGLKVWVKQVRELAYDAEDIIDEFLLRFEHPKQSGLRGRLSKISRVINTLKARHRVASELKQVKSRAVGIYEGRLKYSHNWSNSAERGSTSAAKNYIRSLSERRNDARLVPETLLVGIGRPKEEIVGWLLEDMSQNVKVVAVSGMGGLGKTTLVNQVNRDARVSNHFPHRVWITVSQSFDAHTVLLDIIKQLFKGIDQQVPQEIVSNDTHSLKEDVKSFLSEKKYLIVLDDVWTTTPWESLKYSFPDNSFGSRLMLTTRNAGVANTVTNDIFRGDVHTLEPLTREESWNLFCARVFQGRPCPLHLEESSRHIIGRCKGLPLAIVSICGLLASKEPSAEEWERVRRNLGTELLHGNNQLKDMEKILSLSFNDLTYDLKSCFLYLSMFPEDFRYTKSYLINLWIAEGFVHQMGDATPEEVGDLYFNELVNRSLVQVAEEHVVDENYTMFQVHDLVLELLLRKSKSQNFGIRITEQEVIAQDRVRRITISSTLEKLNRECDLSRLRSLIFLERNIPSNSSIFMSEFLLNCGARLLKVLHCSSLSLNTFPKFITKQYNLRYLNLSSSKVTSIPQSIGRLRKLETLDLRNTLVEELPAEIQQIHSLRHLMVYRTIIEGSPPMATYVGARLPRSIDALISLQTLYTIKVGEGGLDLITSLGKLKQLRDLKIQELREEHGPILCSSIEKMSHLRELMMEPREEDETLDVEHISSPPPYLKQLLMFGHLMKLPSWVAKLQSLVRLQLKWSKLLVDPLESLQALPSLSSLQFYDRAYEGEELCFRAGGFQMLAKLWVRNSGKLRRVTVEEGAMPRLEKLSLRECKLVEDVPLGIEFLTNLKQLEFIDMGDQFIRILSSGSEDSGFERIKHVPSLCMGSVNAEGVVEPYF